MKIEIDLPPHWIALVDGIAACEKQSRKSWIKAAISLNLIGAAEAIGSSNSIEALMPRRPGKMTAETAKGGR